MPGQGEHIREQVLAFLELVPDSWFNAFRDETLYAYLALRVGDYLENISGGSRLPSDLDPYIAVKSLTAMLDPQFRDWMAGKATKEEFKRWLREEGPETWYNRFDWLFYKFLEDKYYQKIWEFVQERAPRVEQVAWALFRAGNVPSGLTSAVLEAVEESAPEYARRLRQLVHDLRQATVFVNGEGGGVYLGQDAKGRPIFITTLSNPEFMFMPDGEEVPTVVLAKLERDKRDFFGVATGWSIFTVPPEHYPTVMRSLKPVAVAPRASGEAVTYSPYYQYWDFFLLNMPVIRAKHHKEYLYEGGGALSPAGLVGLVTETDHIQPVFALADELERLGIQVGRDPQEENKALLNMANYCSSFDFVLRLGVPAWEAWPLVELNRARVKRRLEELVSRTEGLPWRERALRLQEEATRLWADIAGISERCPGGKCPLVPAP